MIYMPPGYTLAVCISLPVCLWVSLFVSLYVCLPVSDYVLHNALSRQLVSWSLTSLFTLSRQCNHQRTVSITADVITEVTITLCCQKHVFRPWRCWLGVRKGIRPVKKFSHVVLAWLSAWSEVQMICIWASCCHCQPITSCIIKIQSGLTFLVLAYPGCPRKKAVKRVSACLSAVKSKTVNKCFNSHHFQKKTSLA